MRTQNYGVELTGITRKETADVVGKFFNNLIYYKGGAYDEYQVVDAKARTWIILRTQALFP